MKYTIFAIGVVIIFIGFFTNPALIYVGAALSFGLMCYQLITDRKRDKTLEEKPLIFRPEDWIIESQNGTPISAKLVIPAGAHKCGENISVRIEQTERKPYVLAEPKIEKGRITITFGPNNFPGNGIALVVRVSSRD